MTVNHGVAGSSPAGDVLVDTIIYNMKSTISTMNPQKTVLLGLSGGVDSAVAALLLKKQGYRVIGAFMKNFSEFKNKLTGECNWVDEKRMAQKMAAHLEIPFIVLDFEKAYTSKVIKPMINAYKQGFTPNSDVWCNTIVKFPLLWKEARKIGADYIATGHYARIKKKYSYQLLAGKDKTKDQSYFLSELTQADLEHTIFPLGNMTKEHVRTIAHKHKFPNADKPSTRGICFVGKVSMKAFLKNYITFKSGPVITPAGLEIGTHEGSQLYTIGERVGTSIGIHLNNAASSKKWYVAAKNTKTNTLLVAPEDHPLLKRKEFLVHNIHLLAKPKSSLKVRIRHLGPLMPCTLKKKAKSFSCVLKKESAGIADGQYAVFYNKDQVIASGEIRF